MSAHGWDAIVVGSGIGGLACAAALARTGYRVLVLEQHEVAGGLTHSFSHAGYSWNVGVHYVGGMGPGAPARAVLDWLTDGAVAMAEIPAPHDLMRFPGGFEVGFLRPESALRHAIRERFPASGAQIDAFFGALAEAERAGIAVLKERAMPSAVSRLHAAWHRKEVSKWCGVTTAEVLSRLSDDARLAAVLASPWLDYGGLPGVSSFAMHAIVMRSYFDGAHYPAGGASAFASALIPVIRKGGGEVRTGAHVAELAVSAGKVTGVRLLGGETISAARVISDAGARNTVVRLLPSDMWYSEWAQEISGLQPSVCHIGLYLGLEGDIRSAGASASNYWFHETWGLDEAIWGDPGTRGSVPPVMFVSFPSLKDPRHATGAPLHHTAEVVVLTRWDAFGAWEDSSHGHRPDAYVALKAVIEMNLLNAFRARFPALVPLIRHHEVSTPLTTTAFTGARQGAIYGLEATPRRMLSPALRPKTPVAGLFLAGQDVATPGVAGAMMGGIMAAAAIDARLFAHLKWEPAGR